MDELKACPFCGSSNTTLDYYEISCPQELGTIVVCNDCGASAKSIVDWNNRPIEDALNARIAELEQDLSNKETEYTDLWDDALAFQSRIAELESLVEQLIWVGNDLLVSNTNPVTITLFNGLVCNAKERER